MSDNENPMTEEIPNVQEEAQAETAQAEAVLEAAPSVTAIPITRDGRYLLVTQGLSPEQGQELISGLHKWAKKPTAQVFVINFGPDVRWELYGVDDGPPEPVKRGKRPVPPPNLPVM